MVRYVVYTGLAGTWLALLLLGTLRAASPAQWPGSTPADSEVGAPPRTQARLRPPAQVAAVRAVSPAEFSRAGRTRPARSGVPLARRAVQIEAAPPPGDGLLSSEAIPSDALPLPPAEPQAAPQGVPAPPPVPVPPPVADQGDDTTRRPRPPGVEWNMTPPLISPDGTMADAMELADFEALAMANNPALARAGATVRAAQGNYVQVGLYPNPFFGYNGTQIQDHGTAGQQGVYFGQVVVLGGKLRLNRAVAAQEIRVSQQDFSAVRYKVLTDVRVRYVEVVVAQRALKLTQTLVHLGEQGVNAAEALLRAQEVSRVDVLQARIEMEQARLQFIRAQNRYNASWRELTAVVGVPEMQPSRVVDLLTQAPPERDWDTTWAQISSMSPELGAAQARVSRAALAVDRATVQPIPDLDNQFMIQHDNSTSTDIGFVQTVAVIPIWDRNQGAIRQARAQLAAARSDLRRVQLALQARLAQAFERYTNARQQVDLYSRDLLPNAQTTFELVAAGYRQGEFPFLNYLTAQRTFFQVNLAYVDALRELWSSTAVIDGLLLSDGLEAGVR